MAPQTAPNNRGLLMSHRNKRNLLVAGLLAVIPSAVLFTYRNAPWNRPGPGGDDDRCKVLAGHTLPVQTLLFHPDGATLTTAAHHFAATVQVEVTDWDVATGQPIARGAAPFKAFRRLAFAPGGRMLAAAGEDGGIWWWDRAGTAAPRRLEGYGSLVCDLAVSGDGGRLATADLEEVVTVWDVGRGRPRALWQRSSKGRSDLCVCLAFAPGGTVLAGGGSDQIVRLWDVAAGEEQAVLRGHAGAILAVAFAPDGRTLASGNGEGVVKLWDVAQQAERATLATAGGEIAAVAFAPDGRTLAVAVDRAVQLWDVATGRRVASLKGHESQVKCLAYSPDGTRLASGGYDKTVRLWDVMRYR
jgi:WD40 repeat protein